jgi:hypothetical protein
VVVCVYKKNLAVLPRNNNIKMNIPGAMPRRGWYWC